MSIRLPVPARVGGAAVTTLSDAAEAVEDFMLVCGHLVPDGPARERFSDCAKALFLQGYGYGALESQRRNPQQVYREAMAEVMKMLTAINGNVLS